MLSDKEIEQQSLNAYGQWAPQWREHATYHSKFEMKSLKDFENIGIGRAVLCVANGYSFEENIDVIRENQDKVDILCCDKTLGNLIDNGITPTYCMVCDANVDYEKYMKPWEGKLQDTVMFNNVCGNTTWSDNGNWKDRYFYANKDIIKSEKEFMGLSGCENVIPAATNVSNAMVVFLTQSDNSGKKNYFGYDKILLIGYDYSWQSDKYYAFNKDGDGKTHYMRHVYGKNIAGEPCYTSSNLHFSMRWLSMYVNTFKLPVVQCTKNTLFGTNYMGDLGANMNYNFKEEDSKKVRGFIEKRHVLAEQLVKTDRNLNRISDDHRYSFMASV